MAIIEEMEEHPLFKPSVKIKSKAGSITVREIDLHIDELDDVIKSLERIRLKYALKREPLYGQIVVTRSYEDGFKEGFVEGYERGRK